MWIDRDHDGPVMQLIVCHPRSEHNRRLWLLRPRGCREVQAGRPRPSPTDFRLAEVSLPSRTPFKRISANAVVCRRECNVVLWAFRAGIAGTIGHIQRQRGSV